MVTADIVVKQLARSILGRHDASSNAGLAIARMQALRCLSASISASNFAKGLFSPGLRAQCAVTSATSDQRPRHAASAAAGACLIRCAVAAAQRPVAPVCPCQQQKGLQKDKCTVLDALIVKMCCGLSGHKRIPQSSHSGSQQSPSRYGNTCRNADTNMSCPMSFEGPGKQGTSAPTEHPPPPSKHHSQV